MPAVLERPEDLLDEPNGDIRNLSWVAEKRDPFTELEEHYGAWIADCASVEELFKKHVYENPEMTGMDLRQHRAVLYRLMSFGETLAVDFFYLQNADRQQVIAYFKLIDQKLSTLRERLNAWHGKLQNQEDIPESIKQAFAELDNGDLLSLEEAFAE